MKPSANRLRTSQIILMVGMTALMTPGLFGCAGLIIGAAGGAAMAAHDRRDAETMLKDEKIESAAIDKIYSDSKLKNKIHINVTSYNQVVLITGEVLTPELRNHAISIIQNIAHIKRIHNELSVENLTSFSSRSSDTLITSKVKSKMIGTKGLDATRVKVVTENGKIYLMGLVTDQEAELAVNVARNTDNVKQVVKIFEMIQEPTEASSPTIINKN